MFVLMRMVLPDFPRVDGAMGNKGEYWPPDRKQQLEALIEPLAAVERPARRAELDQRRAQALASLPDKQQAAALIDQYERQGATPIDLIDRATKLDPDNPRGWYWRGQRDSDYDLDLALRSYDRALALAPQDLDTLKALGALHAYWAKKRPDAAEWPKAFAAYQRALVAKPNDKDVLNDLYRAQFDGKDFAGARDTAMALNGLFEDRTYYILDLADAQRELGDTEKALKAYRNVAKRVGEFDGDGYRAASGLCKLGKPREGLVIFKPDIGYGHMRDEVLEIYNECRKAAGSPLVTDADVRSGKL
jgi:tetratricopeptide (TPR) repeat protein